METDKQTSYRGIATVLAIIFGSLILASFGRAQATKKANDVTSHHQLQEIKLTN